MSELLIFGGGAATGYALAVYTWPTARALLADAGQIVTRVSACATEIAAVLRKAFGQGVGG